jgi:hypothetical protein
MRERRIGKLMTLASKHLAVKQLLRFETPAQRLGGWMPKLFRDFQLAGELFLLTSFFIEPKVAGDFVMLGLALGHYVSPYWFVFTAGRTRS